MTPLKKLYGVTKWLFLELPRKVMTKISYGPLLQSEEPIQSTVESGPLGTGDDINASNPMSIERLCPSTGVNVHHGSLNGLNHIRGFLVRPHATNKTEGCPIGCPITVTAMYPSAVSNNFQSGPAIVPLKVTLHNTLIEEAPVGFEFVVDNPDTFDITGPER
jgi:hypothetical protein